MIVHHLVVGDESHGVSRLALQLTRGRSSTLVAAPRTVADAAEAAEALPARDAAPVLHLHLTDGLLGPDPIDAFRAITDGRRAAVTLHDVPQRAEGHARWQRRSAVYAALASLADLVVVSSEHERAGLEALEVGVDHVLPLPIDGRRVRPRPSDEPTVGVLGWIHPGKGLARLAVTLAALRTPITIVAIGGVAPGHEDHAAALVRGCDVLGVGLRVTGYLDDDALLREAARVRVPVCPHRHVSASGSIGSWMSAGRRPIVVDGGYQRELAARLPGALEVVEDLRAPVGRALHDPAATLLPPGLVVGPSTDRAAQAQHDVLAAWALAAVVEA
ncbi:hypothetical protein [Patulibacter minatonensis]|uniref:hypothetical protein n=1 Tax=Patulibacter minatonensis TaxID=298163 RepID=UPI000683E037|nr:hypothetical protein [Patulibacter minatonensis]